MTAATNLQRLYRGLEALYGLDTGVDPELHLLPLDEQESGRRELVLVREAGDGYVDVGLALDEDMLARLEAQSVEHPLTDARLGDTLPVVEGLSHLLYLAEAARRERPVSGLELETQAEVDKLALCVLHRWPAARSGFSSLVDRLYYQFSLLEDLDDDLRRRYHTANRLALGFSRHLRPHVEARRIGDLRRTLRRFWHGSMGEKHRLAA